MTAAEVVEELRSIGRAWIALADELEGEGEWTGQMYYEAFLQMCERIVSVAGIVARIKPEKGGGIESESAPEE